MKNNTNVDMSDILSGHKELLYAKMASEEPYLKKKKKLTFI